MGRGHKRGRDGGGGYEDQYGDGMMSQDRTDRHPPSNTSGSGFQGGGTAGGGRKDRDVKFVRHIPKFLQGHAHLLGRKPTGNEDDSDEEADEIPLIEEPATRRQGDASDDNDDEKEHQDALEKALMDNPELAEEFPELGDVAMRVKSHAAKEAGNQAFAAKDFQKAVHHFTEALQFRTDPVFFSNRAAAHYALKDYKASLQDAKQVVILDKQWVKGWSRLGAALLALEEWSEAKDAYKKATELEPDDTSLRDMLYKCEAEERKQEMEGKVKFKSSRQGNPGPPKKEGNSSNGKKTTKLSFDVEDDQDS